MRYQVLGILEQETAGQFSQKTQILFYEYPFLKLFNKSLIHPDCSTRHQIHFTKKDTVQSFLIPH